MQIEFWHTNILESDNVTKWSAGKVMQQWVLGSKLQGSKEAAIVCHCELWFLLLHLHAQSQVVRLNNNIHSQV